MQRVEDKHVGYFVVLRKLFQSSSWFDRADCPGKGGQSIKECWCHEETNVTPG